ncbi:hypothetical protein N8T08_008799 [Aspergillus melleus]|uniref:Uncharacterized protein n=1 Tax=Aspergillus melleus TaxID=138277 RepID=A0ACC3AV31_9EURO|nr:hypothetical protein N8T08_008799 [Aspergillus melleus]
MVHPAQPGERLHELVSLPMAYGAALYGLDELARARQEKRMLVLSGAGLAGSAALRIALIKGAVPYVTIADESQVEVVEGSTSLPREWIILESSLASLQSLRFDVLFSSGWADSFVAREAWRFIGTLGRFIDCGWKDMLSHGVLDKLPMSRGAQYLASDMQGLYEFKPQVLSTLLAQAVDLYRHGQILALQPLTVRNIAELPSCVSSFSDDFGSDKTLVAHRESSHEVQFLPTSPSLRLRPDATYLLVGCLGGLGRSLTSWMFQKGARSFLFLSRSGTDSEQAAALTEQLEATGARVTVVRGDVSVRQDVEKAMKAAPVEQPIRGVIQAAMVLRDGIFSNMTYTDWTTSTKPKVNGTMNLHHALANLPLDFFVTTSSVSGILGTPGQSNYATGNTYLDALARHRRLRGSRSVSLILPMVLGVGVVAQNTELEISLKRKGMYGIDETALLQGFEVAILEQQENKDPNDPVVDHIVVGLDPTELRRAIDETGDTVDSFWMTDRRFNGVVQAMNAGSTSRSASAETILGTLRDANGITASEAMNIVAEAVMTKLSRMLLIEMEQIEHDGRSIASYGVDSMVGAELRNWTFKELEMDITYQQLLGASLSINRFRRALLRTLYDRLRDKSRVIEKCRAQDIQERDGKVHVLMADGSEQTGDLVRANEIIPHFISAAEKRSIVTSYNALIAMCPMQPGLGLSNMHCVSNDKFSFLILCQPDTIYFVAHCKLPGGRQSRTVLAGDSALKLTPNAAFGGATAMENAVDLANAIHRAVTAHLNKKPSDVEIRDALQGYEKSRRGRVKGIYLVSWVLTRLQAYDGWLNYIAERWILPCIGLDFVAKQVARTCSEAPKLDYVPIDEDNGTLGWKDNKPAAKRSEGVSVTLSMLFSSIPLLFGAAFVFYSVAFVLMA